MSQPEPHPPLPRKLRALAQRFDLAHVSVLDIGCGSGAHLAHFSERSLGLDRNPDCIADVLERGLRAEECDVSKWGWSQGLGTFDLVFLSDILVHLDDPRAFLEEVPGLLEPNGRVVIAEWSWPENPVLATALSCIIPGGRRTLTAPGHRRRYHRRTLMTDLGEAGLVIDDSSNHSLPPGPLTRALDSIWPPRTIVVRPAG